MQNAEYRIQNSVFRILYSVFCTQHPGIPAYGCHPRGIGDPGLALSRKLPAFTG
jgi:hypothetical protein